MGEGWVSKVLWHIPARQEVMCRIRPQWHLGVLSPSRARQQWKEHESAWHVDKDIPVPR